jgi:tRNA (guanosine-2'-O-)-methyltransferase
MKRTNPDTVESTEFFDPILPFAQVPPEEIVEILGPYITEQRRINLQTVIDQRLLSVCVVTHRIYDPHNGAAIVRSMDAFGIQNLHLTQNELSFRAARTVARSSEKWVSVHQHSTPEACADLLIEQGYQLIATHPEGKLLPHDLKDIPKLALVLGEERYGIPEELQVRCSSTVSVPMRGFVESLNVSVTAAILLQQATQNRPGDLPQELRTRMLARAFMISHPKAGEILEHFGHRPQPLESEPSNLSLFTHSFQTVPLFSPVIL